MTITKAFSIIAYFVGSFLIVTSGFRGDVGSDTLTYSYFYDIIKFDGISYIFSDDNQFDIFFSLLMYISSFLGFDFYGFNIIIALFSWLCFSIVFLKFDDRVFIAFSGLYLTFVYWQLQWSVIRQCVSFWLIVLSFYFIRIKYFWLVSAFFFHKSTVLYAAVLRTNILLKSVTVTLFFLGAYYYFMNYSVLSSDIISNFFGGLERWLTGCFMFAFFYFMFYRYWDFFGRKIFFIVLFFAFVVPIGWRALAVFLPLILTISPGKLKGNRFVIYNLSIFFLFCIKSYSHHSNAFANGDVSEIDFILGLF